MRSAWQLGVGHYLRGRSNRRPVAAVRVAQAAAGLALSSCRAELLLRCYPPSCVRHTFGGLRKFGKELPAALGRATLAWRRRAVSGPYHLRPDPKLDAVLRRSSCKSRQHIREVLYRFTVLVAAASLCLKRAKRGHKLVAYSPKNADH